MQTFKPTRLVAAILFAITGFAHADYTVIDDGLLPSAAAELRAPLRPGETRTAPTRYAIPFNKGSSQLIDDAKYMIDTLLPIMVGQPIRIVGRPDAAPFQRLTENRGNNLRTHLIKQGIAPNLISVEYDDTPNPQPAGQRYTADIFIGRPAPVIATTSTPIASASYSAAAAVGSPSPAPSPAPAAVLPQPAPAVGAVSPVAQPAATADVATRLELARYIAALAQAKQLDPARAFRFIQALTDGPTGISQAVAPAVAAPSSTPVAAAPIAKPAPKEPDLLITASADTVRQKEWILSPDKTLKDNVESWAKLENFNVDWTASNFYKVGRTSVLKGSMLDVIDGVTTFVGLNMAVSHAKRTIYISDKPAPMPVRP